jgi:hypothetical protein
MIVVHQLVLVIVTAQSYKQLIFFINWLKNAPNKDYLPFHNIYY